MKLTIGKLLQVLRTASPSQLAAFREALFKDVTVERTIMADDRRTMYNAVISNCEYINRCDEAGGSDIHSFNSIVPVKLTQSEYIKLGICMEEFLSRLISHNAVGWETIIVKAKKGAKQRDHLFVNRTTKTVIYCEQKNNINLDTEKSIETKEKVRAIMAELASEYPGYTVRGFILAARYLSADEDEAKHIIRHKYADIGVIGVNDYLSLFDLDSCSFTYRTYKETIGEICRLKFNKVA
jgi:hypothetical protein